MWYKNRNKNRIQFSNLVILMNSNFLYNKDTFVRARVLAEITYDMFIYNNASHF